MKIKLPIRNRIEAFAEKHGITTEYLIGIRFAINVAIGSIIVWKTLRFLEDSNPIWSIASLVASSEPEPMEARRMFKSRIINVLTGCATGITFLLIGGSSEWVLPVALATAVLIATYIVRIKTMWRQAPITAAVVIASCFMEDSTHIGIYQGLHKVCEVIFGCVVGLIVSWTMSKVWLIRPQKQLESQ